FLHTLPPPRSTLFPYTTLFRSGGCLQTLELAGLSREDELNLPVDRRRHGEVEPRVRTRAGEARRAEVGLDVALRPRPVGSPLLLLLIARQRHLIFRSLDTLVVLHLFEDAADGLVLGLTGVEDGAAGGGGADAELGIVAVGAALGACVALTDGLEVEAVDEFGRGRDFD